jgi:glycosyltransferase involved in cell wall biosynthesis
MNATRRVLVFAYYFPPLGLSGVQRIARFVKYLPDYGWAPTVVTARPAGYFAFDRELRREIDERGIAVHETRSADPTRVFARGTVPFPSESRRKAFSYFSQLVFVPDNKIGWASAAVTEGLRLHEETPFDAVLATAPPYTALVAGKRFASQARLPLVCDFRDDWLGNPRHNYPTPLHRRRNADLESEVVHAASAVTVINRYIGASLTDRHADIRNAVHVIPQGFDPDDFAHGLEPVRTSARKGPCVFLHAGSFYDAQNPQSFAAALRSFVSSRPEKRGRVRAHFVGATPEAVKVVVDQYRLDDIVSIIPYVDHTTVCQMLLEADVLWMTVGRQPREEQVSTGKLFEYFGTRKPVIGLVPPGAASEALEAYSAGFVCSPNDVPSIAALIERMADLHSTGLLPVASPTEIEPYDRRLLAGELATILSDVAGGAR